MPGKIAQGLFVAQQEVIDHELIAAMCKSTTAARRIRADPRPRLRGHEPLCGHRPADCPSAWFGRMIEQLPASTPPAAKAAGRPIVGILCEYTPRELIMAAGGVPVCLCGGSAKTIPAAEEHLPANLCPLIKSTYGYHVQRSNPFLEMADLVVAETTCDGKKKMYELMAETRPMYVLELPQKAGRRRRAGALGPRAARSSAALLEERFRRRDHRLRSSARRSA